MAQGLPITRPLWEDRNISQRKVDAAMALPAPIVLCQSELFALEMTTLIQTLALEGFLKTLWWRTMDRTSRRATANQLLEELQPWIHSELRERFLNNTMVRRLLPDKVREATMFYLKRWLEMALVTQPLVAGA